MRFFRRRHCPWSLPRCCETHRERPCLTRHRLKATRAVATSRAGVLLRRTFSLPLLRCLCGALRRVPTPIGRWGLPPLRRLYREHLGLRPMGAVCRCKNARSLNSPMWRRSNKYEQSPGVSYRKASPWRFQFNTWLDLTPNFQNPFCVWVCLFVCVLVSLFPLF